MRVKRPDALELEILGPQWQDYVRLGHGLWKGDPDLTLAHDTVDDRVELWWEGGNARPYLIQSWPVAKFDIHMLLAALTQADNTAKPVNKKLEEIERINELAKKEAERKAQEKVDEALEKVAWGFRRDTGADIAPLSTVGLNHGTASGPDQESTDVDT